MATLHDCLIPPEDDEGEEARITIRIKPSVKAKLERVCLRHGTSVANFFRSAAEKVCEELGDA